MIQLLVSLIEWFAVMGLSILGIAFDPAQPCASREPTEFRQAVSWVPANETSESRTASYTYGDCLGGAEVLITDTKPQILAPSDRYDS